MTKLVAQQWSFVGRSDSWRSRDIVSTGHIHGVEHLQRRASSTVNTANLAVTGHTAFNTASMILPRNRKLHKDHIASFSDAFSVRQAGFTNTSGDCELPAETGLQQSVPHRLSNEAIIAITFGVCILASTWTIYYLTGRMAKGMLSRVVALRKWAIADFNSQGVGLIREVWMLGRCE
jgi:hypothetical protein